jgi:hypothetical protein
LEELELSELGSLIERLALLIKGAINELCLSWSGLNDWFVGILLRCQGARVGRRRKRTGVGEGGADGGG